MTIEIPLSRGLSAFVDDADEDIVKPYKWFATQGGKNFYAARSTADGLILMHRAILGFPATDIDHADGCGTNNRRSNLRKCSRAENIRNSRKRTGTVSIFKGVSQCGSKWSVEIEQNGERLYLGSFDEEVSAALQYDRAARLLFGKFARTNAMMGLLDATAGAPDDGAKKRRWRNEMRRLGISARVA